MPKEKEMKPEEITEKIDEMGTDISDVKVDDDGKIQLPASEDDETASDETDEETEETTEEESDETTEEESDEETGEEASQDETTSEAEEDQEEDEGEDKITHDPLKDTKRKLTKVQQENAELRKKIREAEKKEIERKKPAEPPKYTKEELEDLKETDPDEWRRVVNEIETYESRKAEYEREQQDFDQSTQQERLIEIQSRQLDNLLDFAGMMEVKVDKTKPLDEQTEDVKKFFGSPEMKAVDEYLKENQHLRDKETGVFTAKTIRMVFRDLHFDKLVVPHRKKAYNQAVNNIKNAGKGSKLQGSKEADQKGRKKIEDLKPDEIDELGVTDVENYASEI